MNLFARFFFHTALLAVLSSSMVLNAEAKTKAKEAAQPLDGIAAVVNDMIITQSEYNNALTLAQKQLAASNDPNAPLDLHKKVLDQLIDKRLQLQLANAAGMQITDEQLDKAIEGIASQNNVSTDELYAKLESEGMSKEAYREEIHDEMLIQQLQQQQVGSRVTISPQEVNDYMHSKSWQSYSNKEYHIEDVLIPFPVTPSPQDIQAARQEGQDVLAAFSKGLSAQDIVNAETANNHALQGGDVGWVKIPQMPPAIAEKIVNMSPNQSIGPLQTPNGFHVVHLVETRMDKSSNANVAEARKQVEQLIFQRKLNEGIQTWLARVRSEAYINRTPAAVG